MAQTKYPGEGAKGSECSLPSPQKKKKKASQNTWAWCFPVGGFRDQRQARACNLTCLLCPFRTLQTAKSPPHHGARREDQSQNQKESAGSRPPGTNHQGPDALVLPEHQHPRLPPHCGVPRPPSAPAVDPVHADRSGPHSLAVCPPSLLFLYRLCLHQSPLPEAGFPCRHYLQHQPLQVRGCCPGIWEREVWLLMDAKAPPPEWRSERLTSLLTQVLQI